MVPSIGFSRTFKRVLRQCERFAISDWPVLLVGETGVGKEVLARHIHSLSPRARYPLVPINCGAMPANLFESELFGHEKGAFSGASQAFRGLMRAAHGGTLFLDEIGELDPSLQVKLLRVLEGGEVRAIGSCRVERLNIRFMAATNVNLVEAVGAGRFRHDLLQRLSVLCLHVPPLRDRREDIAGLASALCVEIGASLLPEGLEELAGFDWPGNVRQLKNVLIRASVLGGGTICRASLLESLREEIAHCPGGPRAAALEGTLADIERRVIVRALERCGGNRKRAAKELGIAKSTLQEKIRRWRESTESPLPWPLGPLGGVSLVADDVPGSGASHSAAGLDL